MAKTTGPTRLAAVTLAYHDLYTYSKFMFVERKGYKWLQAQHHKIICDALMRVFNGDCKRLIINVPPRYSKTELMINFIGWALGRVPDSEFILTSYSSTLSANNAWQAREMVQHESYKEVFAGVELRTDSKAKAEWKTTAGGVVYAAGAGGTITGYGAGKQREGFGGAILIDDPHKPDEASSDVMRQNVIDWFQNTLESRKNDPKNTPIILIMQRLHEDDLSGFLINGGNGEKWEHISLPAICESGEDLVGRNIGTSLWDAKHTIEMLREMEGANPYNFAGQYQQRPSPASGGLFKPDQLKVIEAIPAETINWVRGWDLASTMDGDFTVGVKLGRLANNSFIIADVMRLRAGVDERDNALLNTAAMDGRGVKQSIPQDPGQAGKSQVLYLTRSLAGYHVLTSPESGDKVTRAEPVAAQINVGNISIVRGAWNKAFIDELRTFPNGSFDDQVDGLSRAFMELIAPPIAAHTRRIPILGR